MSQTKQTASKRGRIIGFLKTYRAWIMGIWVAVVASISFLPQFQLLKFVYDSEQLSYSFRLQFRGEDPVAEDETRIIILAADARSLYPEISVEDLDNNPDLEFFLDSRSWDRSDPWYCRRKSH